MQKFLMNIESTKKFTLFWDCQWCPLSNFQVTKLEIFYSDAHKSFYFMTNSFYHSTNLTISSLLQNNRKSTGTDARDFCLFCLLSENYYSLGHKIKIVILNSTIGFNHIFFFVLIPWMHKIIRKASIICENDESCSVFVESTNRKNPLRHFHNIHNRWFSVSFTSGYYSIGLIEFVVYQLFLSRDHLTRESYRIFGGVDWLSDGGRNSINQNKTLINIFLRLTTRTYSCLTEIFLKTKHK